MIMEKCEDYISHEQSENDRLADVTVLQFGSQLPHVVLSCRQADSYFASHPHSKDEQTK